MCLCGNHVFVYIDIHLKFIIMKILLLNLIDSSFEHVLHSYGLHLISTKKYEICNSFLYYISYLLYNQLSSLELRQNGMAHLNKCLLLNRKRIQQCRI
jgi:hypothetical protein